MVKYRTYSIQPSPSFELSSRIAGASEISEGKRACASPYLAPRRLISPVTWELVTADQIDPMPATVAWSTREKPVSLLVNALSLFIIFLWNMHKDWVMR